MDGTIVNFRRSVTRTHGNFMIVQVEGTDTKEKAVKFVGKKVSYNTGKKELLGEVTKPHGNSGALLVKFETGMPGQAIGQKVKLN
ncbi:50S ribosomal protein L35ae [Candidatus Woesearchaeota archaeon]|nr:50S ribosomal protein L35ae [Candidatus Woesearchaeota archaeon]MCF7901704.1 50S ribosomal protein L35ae [Candidatus Woesearchaeota archaeon]MCF8014018.1 50S ribosomal protein L35ae [Candidatus Woesearchaeota archaeon]